MPEYMLILHEETTDFADFSSEDIQAVLNEYIAWNKKLGAEGKLVGGKKLADEPGKKLTNDGGALRVTDGPFTESKEIIGGYFEIAAANYDEAAEIAKTCPHLNYGGWIELREVDAM